MNRQTSLEWEDNEDLKTLKEAALIGNIRFLKECSNKALDFYLTIFDYEKDRIYHGNIFHIALVDSGEEFIREAIKILPPTISLQLLIQQRKSDLYNPLHVAATIGKLEIVKLLLESFNNCSTTSSNAKPWLQKDVSGNTPCHVALAQAHEDCGLMILEMDLDGICNITTKLGVSVLYRAVYNNLNKVALHILTSAHSFSSSGPGFTTFHIVPNCSKGEEICKLLLKKVPDLITQVSKDGYSILHTWAYEGKLWPFKCLLESSNVPMKVLVDLISSTEHAHGYNPIHSLVVNNNNLSYEEEVVDIANLLIETYKRDCSSSLLPWLAHAKNGATPLSLAIRNGYECFAYNLLSMDNDALHTFPGNALHFAVQEGRDVVALNMLEIIQNKGWTRLLVNALHYAPKCKEFCKALLRQHPEFLKERGRYGETVLHNWVALGELWPFEYLLQSNKIDVEWRNYFITLI